MNRVNKLSFFFQLHLVRIAETLHKVDMNQSNLLNLFDGLVIDKQLRDKLNFIIKHFILFKSDATKILIAIFKLTELIACQTFKIFFQLKTSWNIFIFYDEINYFLFGQISLNLWQSRQFN